MKKAMLMLFFFLLVPRLSDGDTHRLKLRTSYHPEYVRIVLEGHESVMKKARVYQKGKGILVRFPDTEFSIQTEKSVVAYNRADKDSVIFYPGDFRGLKVFTLERPSRLVIDVYVEGKQKRIMPPAQKRAEPAKKSEPAVAEKKREHEPFKIRTVVIDAGHGGYEGGVEGDGRREKNVVLDIVRKLSALVEKGDTRAVLTRGSDVFMSQNERAQIANSSDADVFLSLHLGNHDDVVIYVPVVDDRYSDIVRPHLSNRGQADHIQESLALRDAMEEAFASDFGDSMVSVNPLPYSILSKVDSAALMIELPSFSDIYYVEEILTEIADTIYKGLYMYEEIREN